EGHLLRGAQVLQLVQHVALPPDVADGAAGEVRGNGDVVGDSAQRQVVEDRTAQCSRVSLGSAGDVQLVDEGKAGDRGVDPISSAQPQFARRAAGVRVAEQDTLALQGAAVLRLRDSEGQSAGTAS